MSRYIDKAKLIADLQTDKWIVENSLKYVLQDINEQPEADVVEVIRCKDCKYCEVWDYFGEPCYRCIGKWDISGATCADITLDDYCSYAERKDDISE